jgi:hypothetical protein
MKLYTSVKNNKIKIIRESNYPNIEEKVEGFCSNNDIIGIQSHIDENSKLIFIVHYK